MRPFTFFPFLLFFTLASAHNFAVFPEELRKLLTASSDSSNSTSTNTSNSSNSSTPVSPFILMTLTNPQSTLSAEEAQTLSDLIADRDDFTRYNSHFDAVAKIFVPENDDYENSILIEGLPFYVIGGVIIFIGLMFCIFRYGFGICGGRKSKAVISITRSARNCTLVMVGVGLTLWFCGMIVAIVGASKYNDALETTNDAMENEGNLILSQTESFSTVAGSINALNLTWYNDTNETFYLPVSYRFPMLLDEAKMIKSGSSNFAVYLNSDNKVFQGFLWFFFVFGLIMGGLLIFAIVKQLGAIANILGIIFIVLSAMAFGVAGFYFSQTFKVADICQQNREIIAQNFPDSGLGILKYMNRFSDSSEKLLFEEKYQSARDLQLASDFYLLYLNNTGNSSVSLRIKHQTDIISLYNNGTFAYDPQLSKWGQIVSLLDTTLQYVNDLKDLVGLRRYSVVSEANFCYVGLPNLYLGFVGILIQGIAWWLLLIAGVQLKDVLEKLRSDKESMINIRQAGGYA